MDDFKDLTWTNTPSSSSSSAKSKPPSQYDSFHMMAASQSQRGTPNYLSSTISGLPPSRSLTPTNQTTTKNPVPGKAPDAFSNLLNFGGSSTSNGANMSIAERQAKLEQERRDKERQDKEVLQGQSAFWDSFESSSATKQGAVGTNGRALAPALAIPAMAPMLRPTSSLSSRDGPTTSKSSQSSVIRPVLSPSSSSTSSKTAPLNVWDFDLLGGTSKASVTIQPAASISVAPANDLLGEFDLLSGGPPASSLQPKPPLRELSPQVVHTSTPGDFDWGDGTMDGRAGLLDDAESDSDNDQDILGTLGKPVKQARPSDSTACGPSPAQRPVPPSSRPRASSPPPHVLGKLVEMGFSVKQAREALAVTDTGMDVEAAMDILLARSAVDPEEDSAPPVVVEEDPRVAEEAARRRRQQERRHGGPSSRANLTPVAQNQNGDIPRSRNAVDDDTATPDTLGQLADHADKLVTQASEIGATLFSKANSLWSRANKAYVDTTAKSKDGEVPVATGSSGGPVRPKWMVDQQGVEGVSPVKGSSKRRGSGFRDEDDQHDYQNGRPPRPEASSSRKTSGSQQQPSVQSVSEVLVGSLFAPTPEASSSYISPHRRKKGSNAASAPPASSRRAPSPAPPKPRRVYVACPIDTLADATAYRTAGSAAYKLGQYADAELKFSSAINQLPSNHMALIPLWNNRAMSRLKTGDTSGAVGDCSSVLDLIGLGWTHGDDGDDGGKDGAGVPLGDAAVKALTRRAMAFEMGEKWERAKEDWERLMGVGERWGPAGAKARAEAARGLERCRKITNPPPKTAPPSARSTETRPMARKKPSSTPAVTPSGEASARLRASNAAAEADESERYRLKDSVDARIISWKGGKENNIRALIASLENVLWPELGWVKVGMSELIMEQQVKVRYMKAIAKLHPDKLRNATVEHQMIANGVFGALNEAYNLFTSQK
ncbi:hypothetical protein FRB94_001869 [Tulasnella sp. JGI-2019a]|nr:hypothetical protein FRB94_001869 [Tulasnella sp. JGI-2019a]KAG9017264.1 hypothetical protein FRB93_007377 [Tulasnella sp. JGI-2019a]